MQKKFSLKWLYVLTIVVGIFLCVIVLFNDKNISPVMTNIPDKTEATQQMSVRIPKIALNARIENVGITKEGLMESPKGPNGVGWFHLGTLPGEIGSAVMDGHSGWKDGIPAVFDNLYKLKVGDKIYVKNQKGEDLVFNVKEIRIYNPSENTEEVFNSSDGIAHLNIITCSGLWDEFTKSHTKRLVVFSDME
ncbi:MAG: class F sortase [Patescibacteria group bacterium]